MSGSKAVGPTMYGAVRPPAQMGGPAVEADLTNMARLRVHRGLPVVPSQDEVAAVFQALQVEHRLLAQVLQGTGMRLFEGLQLRIKDVDFSHQIIVVHCGKGDKDRLLMLPPAPGAGPAGAGSPCAHGLAAGSPSRLRHQRGSRPAGPCRCRHHHDLHTCAQDRRRRRAQPHGFNDPALTAHRTPAGPGRGANKVKPRCRTAGQSKPPPANLRESRPVAAP